MATLTAQEIAQLFQLPRGPKVEYDLWLPDTYNGAITTGEERQLWDCACWNWALCAGAERNVNAATSAMSLYSQTNPAMVQAPTAFGSEPQLGAHWNDAVFLLDEDGQWAFMRAMLRVAARQNGLTPSDAATDYSLVMTTPGHEWYHWRHWGIAIHKDGESIFIQTIPEAYISLGSSILWDSDKPGFHTESVYLTGLHDAHVHVLRQFLALPRCHQCRIIKPRRSSVVTRWSRCDAGHFYCFTHAWALPRYSQRGYSMPGCSDMSCRRYVHEIKDFDRFLNVRGAVPAL
jgi:hypothetical protein